MGGSNADGTPGFASRRRGWDLPIPDLLVKHRVTAVFHGHDHFYAHEERDAVAYQEVPQPGDARGGSARTAVDYGYKSGTVLGGTGYLRVKVGTDGAAVEYVRMEAAGLAGRVCRSICPAAGGPAGSKFLLLAAAGLWCYVWLTDRALL